MFQLKNRFGRVAASSCCGALPYSSALGDNGVQLQIRCASSKKPVPKKKVPTPPKGPNKPTVVKGKGPALAKISKANSASTATAASTATPFDSFKLPDFDSTIIDVRLTNQIGGDLSEMSVFVERATGNNSVCALCQQSIPAGDLRLGLRLDSSLGDFAVVRWNHLCCFPSVAHRYPSLVACPEDIRGLSEVSSTEDIRSVLSAALLDSSVLPSKKIMAAATMLHNAGEVVSQLTTSQLSSIATDAGYTFGAYPPGRSSLVSYVTDAVTFGAIASCTECKGGLLSFSDHHYKCKGYLDSFTRCGHITKDVTRSPLTVSDKVLRNALITSGACPGLAIASQRPLLSDPNPPVADRVNSPPRASKVFEPFRVFLHPSAADLEPLLLAGGLMPMNLFKSPATWSKSNLGIGGSCFRDIAVIRQDQKTPIDLKLFGVVVVDAGFVESCARLGYHPGYIPFEDRTFCCKSLSLLQKRSQRLKIKDKLAVTKSDTTTTPSDKKVVRVKGDVAIDPDALDSVSDNAMVTRLDSTHPFHASFSKTDFGTGKNSFYILQIIHDSSPKVSGCPYILFRKWGRVGDVQRTGTKCEPMRSKYAAQRQFEKIFAERAGYDWSDKADHEGKDPKPGHYTLLSIQLVSDMATQPDTPTAVDKAKKLEAPTESLVKRLFDVSAINESLVEMEIDVKKLPLGNITDSVIQRGLKTLQTIQTVVTEIEAKKEESQNRKALVTLNNQFYTYIPHAITKEEMRSNKLLLDTSAKIAEKVQLLTDLGQIAVTAKLLSQSSNSPVYTHYSMLKTDMVVVPPNDPRFEMVQQYMKDTHGPTHNFTAKLRNLWCIEREGEDAKYTSKHADTANRTLLWHGSRFTNWVGILSQGLRIAPPEAPVTGYMFGKGIYFADMFSKSAQYATGFSGDGEGILALAEVALGKSGARYRSDFVTSLPKDQLSIHAKGKYSPSGHSIIEQGVKVPGSWSPSKDPDVSSLLYNEFIVYTENQVRMKYLCQVDFKRK